MTLLERIDQDYLHAFKNRETQTVDTLRLIKSDLKNEAIKIGGLGTLLTDEQVISVLSRMVKQRNDSIAQYKAAGRDELAQKETAELDVIQKYLPQAMDETELQQLVDSVIAEVSAASKADMGKVMGALKVKLTNPADMAKAAQLVAQKLA